MFKLTRVRAFGRVAALSRLERRRLAKVSVELGRRVVALPGPEL